MKLVLDTHAALWWLSDDDRLGSSARAHMTDAANQVLVSAAIVWEAAIKRGLGKLRAPAELGAALVGAGALALPITLEHAAAVAELPPHHRDPFDRLLVAQAMIERAVLVSRDEELRPYGVPIVW